MHINTHTHRHACACAHTQILRDIHAVQTIFYLRESDDLGGILRHGQGPELAVNCDQLIALRGFKLIAQGEHPGS